MKRILPAFLVLLSACTSIDYRQGPVPGLERMTVEEHFVDVTEIYVRCSRCGKLGFELPVACTCINFRTNHAVIWLTRGASPSTIEHERAHGRGYDHHDGGLRSRYATWKQAGGKTIAEPREPTYRAGIKLSNAGESAAGTPSE